MIRTFAECGILGESFFRISVRTRKENEQLLDALSEFFKLSKPRNGVKKTPSLMIQGVSSNAGKSIIATALCRILHQDGVRVAPFKSQNMALNSSVTPNGEEIARAQVLQAEACRVVPDVRMNPVLIKPNSHTASQVIVNGKAIGTMTYADFIKRKPAIFEDVKRAYDSLASEYDVMMIEGAGSPAEINLKSHDIVNMAMARYAESKVLLVGDIDRGGVFASLVGTMEMITAEERALVGGFIINQFRGDESLLAPALDYTKHRTHCPVLGVVPYLKDLGLPEEDSVAFKKGNVLYQSEDDACIDIAVISLPRISNFTDLDALALEPDVRIRVIERPEELDNPDVIILPGSKDVSGDMHFLDVKNFSDLIRAKAQDGSTHIIGICGGFQILGQTITDPDGVESSRRKSKGLGLLNMSTCLNPGKDS